VSYPRTVALKANPVCVMFCIPTFDSSLCCRCWQSSVPLSRWFGSGCEVPDCWEELQ